MNKNDVLTFLSESGLENIEEIKYKEDVLVVRFYYDFDEDELEAAKAYANDESDDEEEGDKWYNEYFIPYLNDLAIDNVGEIIEDAMEKAQFESQYMSYDVDEENYDYAEFIAVFSNSSNDVKIEDVLDELNL